MATDTKDAKADEAEKGGKKKLIMIVVVVLLVAGGGGYFMFGRKSSAPAAAPVFKPGKVVVLDPLTVNLADGHFLKLSLALQATTKAKETPDGSKALDIAVNLFSNRSMAELSSTAARTKFMKQLKTLVVKAYDTDVMDVYLTGFVMQ